MKFLRHTFIRVLLGYCALLLPGSAYGQAGGTETNGNNIPEYFLGTFENIIPKKIGGTNPDTKLSMDCGATYGCILRMEGMSADHKENGIRPVSAEILKAAQGSLQFAKDHKDSAQLTSTVWSAKHLRLLLTSTAEIDECINFPNTPDGSMILCKLDHNPWEKPVILLMGWTMVNHLSPTALFSTYEITPLFQETPASVCPVIPQAQSASTLSEAQRNFESAALSANGGLHYLYGLGFPGDSGKAEQYIFSEDISIPKTSADGPQPMTATYSVLSPPSKPLPKIRLSEKYLIGGVAYPIALPPQGEIVYVGKDVLEKSFATDGKTVGASVLGTDYQVVRLEGLITDTPNAFFTHSSIGWALVGTHLDKAMWRCGSAYIKATRKAYGDTFFDSGRVIKDGTPFDNWIGAGQPGDSSIYLNKAAYDSIKAALKAKAVN